MLSFGEKIVYLLLLGALILLMSVGIGLVVPRLFKISCY